MNDKEKTANKNVQNTWTLNHKASRNFYYISLISYTICLLYFLPDNIKYGRNGVMAIDSTSSVFIITAFILYLRKRVSMKLAFTVYVYSALLNICFSCWYYFKQTAEYTDLLLICTSIYCINLAIGGLCLGYKNALYSAALYIAALGPVIYLSDNPFLNRYGIIICIMMLTFAIGFAGFLRLLDKSYQKELRLKEEIRHKDKILAEEQEKVLKYELDNKHREIVTKSLFLAEHAENNERFIQDLQNLQQKLKLDDKKMIDTVISKHRIDQQEEYWKDFETNFRNVHPEFYKKLNDLCPNLSPAELKLATLISLGLSSKQIACLCSITPESVDVSRSRLRTKLNLSQDTNLKTFLLGVQYFS